MFRILVSDKLGADGLDLLEHAPDVDFDVRTGLSEDELIEAIGEYDGLIIRSGTTVTESVLAAGERLKVVGRAGVGIDNVDVRAATKLGVVVLNTPSANTIATAEHTMALLLASARNVALSHTAMADGRWERADYVGTELHGKTLGVLGFGRVGRMVSERAHAFGMHIVAYDPFVPESVARETGAELLELDDVLATSDFVTLHMTLTNETQHLINKSSLAKMKPGAILVNAARGGLVDEAAVAEALDANQLRAFGTDVYSSEPPDSSNPLVGHAAVTHTPHLGASTEEAQRDVAVQVAEQVLAALRGDPISGSVNVAKSGGDESDLVAPFVELAEKIGRLQMAMATGSIASIEVEVQSSSADELIRPVAAGILKGLLDSVVAGRVNYVNAPVLAEERGIKISRSVGVGESDYQNMLSCRVRWASGDVAEANEERVVSGAVFGHTQARIVQISGYAFEADPNGFVLLMLNNDIPGVIGEVGTVLGRHHVNIAEWRLGRDEDRHEALSFINLDSEPDPAALEELRSLPAVTKAILVEL
ncbi:MAG: phosphoglycerate dehydrogenase [Acidimicrobiales bacterium]|nr:phosphoglycerate dehydrogenase [Acidimicrobiales bacterium]RZV47377.1 MAG: phosphoglycerate dehydrogenase [Acidimicrobiales bacterium]